MNKLLVSIKMNETHFKGVVFMKNDQSFFKMTQIIEKQFSYNSYNGYPDSILPYSIKLGSGNVLLSAPHAVNHMRENSVKVADLYTGAIALLVQMRTNAHCIYSNRIADEDPNYTIGGQYKETLKELCRHHEIDLILDLHGAHRSREFAIDLGTIYGQSISDQKVLTIKELFQQNGIKDVRVNDTFAASHPGTITHFASKVLKIDAVQLEINRFFRNPKSNVAAFSSLLDSLTAIVHYFKKG